MELRTLSVFLPVFLAFPAFSAAEDPCRPLCEKIESCAEQSGHPELGRLLCHMARCETGCRKEVRSPSGRYRGPFQFAASTWRGVCQTIFREKKIQTCSGKRAIHDTCCTAICSAEIIAGNRNGGLKNWPSCGKQAERAVAAESLGK